MTRPTWEQYWLSHAKLTATRSTCSRRQVGAVFVSPDNQLLSAGYNGAPKGLPHCLHDGTEAHCMISVHAEANAIASAARRGIAVEGSTCYTTLSPCAGCASLLVNTGVKEVVYLDVYTNFSEGLLILNEANIWFGRKSVL